MGGPAVAVAVAVAIVVVAAAMIGGVLGGPTWCIARSGVAATALQRALDYACGSGVADCAAVQPSGLCYLPNTLPSHASYAFNSYYQRSNAAPGSCDFGGTATVTVTDPSYGSCSYPSSASAAGGSTNTPSTNTSSGTPATIFTPPTSGDSSGGGLSPPGFGSTVPDIDTSTASLLRPLLLATSLCFVSLIL